MGGPHHLPTRPLVEEDVGSLVPLQVEVVVLVRREHAAAQHCQDVDARRLEGPAASGLVAVGLPKHVGLAGHAH